LILFFFYFFSFSSSTKKYSMHLAEPRQAHAWRRGSAPAARVRMSRR
jgi:hypothetical protein